MDILHSGITAVVQGLTEFLPVSSSGHLVLSSALYKYFTGQSLDTGNEEIFFDIMLHVGTLVAVCVYFRKELMDLIKGFLSAVANRSFKGNEEAMTVLYIMLATFATAMVVLPIKGFVEGLMDKPAIVGLFLIGTGCLLFGTELISKKRLTQPVEGAIVPKITWKRALIMGIAQGFAVSPGISRSGSTIAAGLLTGLDRVSCAKFSFIMSIPIIILGALSDAIHLGLDDLVKFNWTSIAFGTVLAALVGYYCIKYFILFLSKYSLNAFAYYCFAVGILMFTGFTFLI